jgi:integrase
LLKTVDSSLFKETAALKEASSRRVLPITKWTKKYFSEAMEDHQKKRILFGLDYNKSDFLIVYDDGKPISEMTLSHNFKKLLIKSRLPHIRFHDLRHSAATNMHQLTGDFYTVGEILGHSMKGIGNTLGLGSNLEAVTERYVDVRLKRKSYVLETYHKKIIQNSREER